jgi:Domain of unknown function (DUF5615)
VRALLDEQLNEASARALAAFSLSRGRDDDYVHIYDLGAGGMADAEIPALCKEHSVDLLITANVVDFGARKALYAALIDAGVSVAVLRPGRQRFDAEVQHAMLALHRATIVRRLEEAHSPILLRVSFSQVVVRTLDELISEIEGQ